MGEYFPSIRFLPYRRAAVAGCFFTLACVNTAWPTCLGSDSNTKTSRSAEPVQAVESDSPTSRDWAVERFNETAGTQLKKLGDLISSIAIGTSESTAADNIAAAGQFAADSFTTAGFRPSVLTTIYDADSYRVRRGSVEPQLPSASVDDVTGRQRLLNSIYGLTIPFVEAREVRTKFKITGAEVGSGEILSTVLVEVVGQTSTGDLVEQHATWQVRWEQPTEGPPKLRSVTVVDFEESTNESRQGHWFVDRTTDVLAANAAYNDQLVYGVDHWQNHVDRTFGVHYSGHAGLAIGDVNGDGRDDVYLCQTGGVPNRLFVQNADGTATDVSAAAGVDWLDISHAALLIDVDNDGDQDLIVGLSYFVMFMANDGSGKFTQMRRIPLETGSPMSFAAADFDRDGLVDVYACLYGAGSNSNPVVARTSPTARESLASPPTVYHDANNGGENVLFRNRGNWVFSNWTQIAGLSQHNHRFSFAASWEDFDNDGDPDLYVANDYGRNSLYRNDAGKFTDVAVECGVQDIAAGMSAAWGDYNGDGWMDLYVGNMFSAAGGRVTGQSQFFPDLDEGTRRLYRRHARGNSLFAGSASGTFLDVSEDAHVSMARWAWSSNFVDLNNDGLEDLVVANGYVTQEDTKDL